MTALWIKEDELVGKTVTCQAGWDNEFRGIVLAVHTAKSLIKVQDEETGEVLVGNQWEED